MRCLFQLFLLLLVLAAILAVVLCNVYVNLSGRGKIFSDADRTPVREIGLVLGAPPRRPNGDENLFFKYRMDAAAELFRKGKVRRFIVSGSRTGQNEPAAMRDGLMTRGVPSRAITLDDAGLRTFDSIVRAKRVFGTSQFTIISQRDHDARALMIAQHHHLDAIAFAARDVPFTGAPLIHIREWIARVRLMLDLYVLPLLPHHARTTASGEDALHSTGTLRFC